MHEQALDPTLLQTLRAAAATSLADKLRTGSAILGERRHVSALAATVALSSAPITADAQGQIWADEALRIMSGVVHHYAGTIHRFSADGLLALFSVPMVREDDSRRAAQAALELLRVIAALNCRLDELHGHTLDVRLALHQGPLIISPAGFGGLDYTPIGDTVDYTLQLQRAALPGQILCSAALADRLGRTFALRPLPARPGATGPDAFELLAAAPAERAALSPHGRSRLVGRADELAQLMAAFHGLYKQQQSRVVLVTGEAGIGKSRLVAEFRAALDSLPVRVYGASGAVHTQALPFALVAELLRAVAGRTAIAGSTTQEELLQATLHRLGLQPELRLYLRQFFVSSPHAAPADLPPPILDPVVLRRQVHFALRQLFLAVAREAPTIFVIEDAQWLDAASRDLFEHLIQSGLDAQPFGTMLVIVGRDAERQSSLRSLITAARLPELLVDLQLEPLDLAELQALVEQLLDSPPADERLPLRIAERAAGNPLYAEEIVRTLRAQQSGTPEAGEEAAAEQLIEPVPATLNELLATRLSILPGRLRRLLQSAAVIGRTFSQPLLMALTSLEPAQLAADLDELGARHFLAPSPAGDASYAFQHGMLHETIYQVLLHDDRQRLHGQVAALIEADAQLPGDERIPLLAYHFAASATPFRAVPYLLAAAEHSARTYSNETAIQQYRHALELIEAGAGQPLHTVARAIIGLARALKFTGQFGEAAVMLRRAVESLGDADSDQRRLLAEALRELADVYHRDGELESAVTALQRGITLLATEHGGQARRLWRSLLDRLAALRFRQGDLGEADRLATWATSHAPEQDDQDPITLASIYNTLAGIHWQRGELQRASQALALSLELYQAVDYAWGTATTYTNLGVLNHSQGRWPEALAHFQRSDELRQQIGYLPERAINLKNLGILQMEMGEHERAFESLNRSLTLSRRLGDDYGVVVAALQLADLRLLQSRIDEAQRYLDLAGTLIDVAGEDEAILLRWLTALLQAARGLVPTAIASARAALALAVEAGMSDLEADCRRVLGSLLGRSGALQEAEAELETALRLSVEQRNLYRQGLTAYELGWLSRRTYELQGDPSYRASATARLRHAAALFEKLPARFDLERVRRALAELQ